MTPINCARNLAEFLREQFQGYSSPDEKVAGNSITIRDGFLPKQTTMDAKRRQNPYIVIRPVKVEDDDKEGSTADLQILVTTYDDDKEDGHLALYHILEFIRQSLLTHKLIKKKNMLQMPMKTMIPEEQPFPQWWGYMEVTYSIGQPGINGFADGGAYLVRPQLNTSYKEVKA